MSSLSQTILHGLGQPKTIIRATISQIGTVKTMIITKLRSVMEQERQRMDHQLNISWQ